MKDKQVLSERLLKQFLELLDKQPKKDVKNLMLLLDEIVGETKAYDKGYPQGCY